MKQATTRQQENLYSHGKQVRQAYLKFNCGSISAIQLREELSNLGIQETGAFLRLLNQNGGNTLQYSKFLMSLTHIDEEDIEDYKDSFRPPVKATAPSVTPFATMEDVMRPPQPSTPKGNIGDVITWSTPPTKDVTPSRKKPVPTSFKETPLVTYQPVEYVSVVQEQNIPASESENGEQSAPAPFTPQERNELIHAFLGGSLNGTQFRRQLEERAGIESSENLDHIIEEHENGKTIKFLDIVKELTSLQNKPKFKKIERAQVANSTTRSTVDIFNMAEATDHLEERVAVPHSKEQLPSLRHQTNLFTWEDAADHKVLPSRKLGVGAYAGSNDIFDRTPEQPKVKPAISPAQHAMAEGDSGDIFTWSTPPKRSEQTGRNAKKPTAHAAGGGISSIP
eukprot:CAMPEP_0117053672 /NCGR_PEP_ID=MMETSP0472-20121206/37133_1 /TAXON_ID=693140 ORGANISM="Tiarina fusus, Strain LIS" /NCGR_SAMPLE_ID=MMETSP0472 /ASSEMBLY_ACC=CAM_ASM_000603 /LENGTH=394 /DNA_ID=CAMNT_0004768837 /DNA_START=63 /DNA_END=1243 /DNA_ORIENTATION=+